MLVRTRVLLTLATVVAVVASMVAPAAAASWNFETLDGGATTGGRVDSDVGQYSSTVIFAGGPHTFYRDAEDGYLRHGWWTGAKWAYETLDGNSNSGGRKLADVGTDVKAVLFGGAPHVFYYNVTSGDLRHAWWNGLEWSYETLDSTNDVGTDITVVNYAAGPHVFYYDVTNGGLRHAWWDGLRWGKETLDGAMSPGGGGRVADDVGQWGAALIYAGGPHIFYYNDTESTLRHAWWTGLAWGFETLDGLGGPNPGRTVDSVGSDVSVIVYNGGPHVFYYDITGGDLRHAWWTGSTWGFETLDGDRTVGGRMDSDVGTYTSAILYNGNPVVFYSTGGSDPQDLRHTWWTGAAWGFGTLDGSPSAMSASSGDVGSDGSALLYGGQPHFWYYDAGSGNLRHAWYG